VKKPKFFGLALEPGPNKIAKNTFVQVYMGLSRFCAELTIEERVIVKSSLFGEGKTRQAAVSALEKRVRAIAAIANNADGKVKRNAKKAH
jgi:hypothetical protein